MTRIEAGVELSIDAAIAALGATIAPISVAEIVPTRAALHRVLARDLVSGIDLPNADNAAMDGYAVRAADLQRNASLREVGLALAGRPCSARVELGTAVRIMTGAALPLGADTVVMLEHVAVSEGEIRVITATEPGANVRRRGEHINAGATALAKTVKRNGHTFTDVKLTFTGLVGNGVYSLFYITLGPDSENPLCPGVERALGGLNLLVPSF